jgi:hypothetical protein
MTPCPDPPALPAGRVDDPLGRWIWLFVECSGTCCAAPLKSHAGGAVVVASRAASEELRRLAR